MERRPLSAALDGPVGRQAARLVKFGVTGLIGVAIAYALFRGFLMLLPWQAANALSWAGSVGFGFVVNRRFTFAIRGRDGRPQQAGLYFFGAFLQLGISYVVFGILLDRLHWPVTPAFVVMTAITAAFGFGFQSLVTFRRRPALPA